MNKKSGFTLVELLCALTIIGIVSVLAISTMNKEKKDATRYLYTNAYSTVSKAYYNIIRDGQSPFQNSIEINDEEINIVHTENEDTGTEIICQGLADYINTMGDFNCDSKKFSSQIATDDDFAENKLQFKATNGMKFYISNIVESDDENNNFKFYIAYVDINGDKRPNSIVPIVTKDNENMTEFERYKNTIKPDIFAFALLPDGSTCPIGIPEIDSEILTARIAYHNGQEPQFSKEPLPYFVAQSAAWGLYTDERYTNAENQADVMYNPNEVFTQNAKIRETIRNDSNIYETVPSTEMFPAILQNIGVSCRTGTPYNCRVGDMESCYIFIDKYR